MDTARPGADLDLGTPNEKYHGPGEGDGGQTYPLNDKYLGNALFIQEREKKNVDDNKFGGEILFDFWDVMHHLTITEAGVLDIEEAEADSTNINSFITPTYEIILDEVEGGGDNGITNVKLSGSPDPMSYLKLTLYGSGAITHMKGCIKDKNTAPEIIDPTDKTKPFELKAGETFIVDVESKDDFDKEGMGLSYSVPAESNYEIDEYGNLSFKHAPTEPGNFDVKVTVTDSGGLTDMQVVWIKVINMAPMITYPTDQSKPFELKAGDTFIVDVESKDDFDAEEDGLKYSVPANTNYVIDPDTGKLSFKYAPTKPGNFDVKVTVTDSGGLTDMQEIWIKVINMAPMITYPTDQSKPFELKAGDTFIVDVESKDDFDAEEDGLKYSVPANTNYVIDPDTGKLSFKYAPTKPGNFDVKVTVTDSGGLTDMQEIWIKVINMAPMITYPTDQSKPFELKAGDTFIVDVESKDDFDAEDDGLKYSVPANTNYVIDPDTGKLSFKYAPTKPGNFDVKVTVTDSGGLTDMQEIWIKVINMAPMITYPTDQSKPFELKAGDTFIVDVESKDDFDAEEDGLTYSVPANTNYVIDPDTGKLSFKYAPTKPGNFDVKVTVTDSGGLTDMQEIWIKVINMAPMITYPTDQSKPFELKAGDTFIVDVESKDDFDAEEDGLTYSVPANTNYVIDPDTGKLSFKYAPTKPGNFDVKVTVTDSGGLTDMQEIWIKVINMAPMITYPTDQSKPFELKAGDTFIVDVESKDDFDAEEDGLKYSVPANTNYVIDPDTGKLSFKYAPTKPGNFDVKVTVTDSGGLTDMQEIWIKVINMAPMITYPTDQSKPFELKAGDTFIVDVESKDDFDAEEDGLKYSVPANTNYVIDPDTGKLSFKYAPTKPGNFDVKVTVTDSGGLTDMQEIWIKVINMAPMITYPTDQSKPFELKAGDTFIVDVESKDDFDAEEDGLKYSVPANTNYVIDPDTGKLSFKYAPTKPGNFDVKVTVTDSGGLTDMQEIWIKVINMAPMITYPDDHTGTIPVKFGETFIVDVESKDDFDKEGDGLTYSVPHNTNYKIDEYGNLSFIKAPKPGNYDVVVTVTDHGGLSDKQGIWIKVPNPYLHDRHCKSLSNSPSASYPDFGCPKEYPICLDSYYNKVPLGQKGKVCRAAW